MKNIVLFLLVALGLGACQSSQSSGSKGLGSSDSAKSSPEIRVAPLPQDPLIQAYFNQSQADEYTEPYRQQKRSGDNLEALVVDTINGAKFSVALAVQEIRLPLVAEALIKKHRAGVQVRVVIENSYNQTWAEQQGNLQDAETEGNEREVSRGEELLALIDRNGDGQASAAEIAQGDAIYMLRQAQVPLIDDRADGSEGSGLMHHKFLVVDDRLVVTGSTNLTPSDTHGDFKAPDTRGNNNHWLRFDSLALAQIFRQEFNVLWGDGPGGKTNSLFGVQKPKRPPQKATLGSTIVTVNFSPQSSQDPWEKSSNGLIAQTLAQTSRQADLALFVFSEQALADVLQTRHRQGVQVRVLIDGGFAFRDYSEGLDLLGVALPRKCKAEKANNPWNPPIASVGIGNLPKGDKLHHKFAVVDQQTVITGSHNWSASANQTNDETLLIFTNPIVAAHFQREFDRLYGSASLGLPTGIQSKVAQSTQACP
jgi:phosphatidylserine/phosphatidylglycerophosphate/cardiolipin synthase-like enzyme